MDNFLVLGKPLCMYSTHKMTKSMHSNKFLWNILSCKWVCSGASVWCFVTRSLKLYHVYSLARYFIQSWPLWSTTSKIPAPGDQFWSPRYREQNTVLQFHSPKSPADFLSRHHFMVEKFPIFQVSTRSNQRFIL